MLSTAVAEAVDPADLVGHRGGPLLIQGTAATGKTTILLRRFQWLLSQGLAPERIALLTPSAARADALAARLEAAIPGGYDELVVVAPADLAATVLMRAPGRRHLPGALLSAGERLAMLSERVDELDLTHHDFGGNASALMASFIVRIDALKAQLIGAEDYQRWAASLDDDASLRAAARARRHPVHGAREREFAAIFAAHDRMLRRSGAIDGGDLMALAIAAADELSAGAFGHVLVDDAHELSRDGAMLALALAGENLTVAGDPQAAGAFRGAAPERLASFATAQTRRALLPTIHRLPEQRFWRAANERAQAQAVAAAIERLVRREHVPPGRVAVVVGDIAHDGRPVSAALEERVLPHRVIGEGAFFQRPEIRDLLAWLRLAADPSDASAAVRALARPPVELRSVDIARCTQIARRRKLDMVAALAAATESPQVPPEARERIRTFLKLYRASATPLDSMRPDLYVHRLIDRLGLRRRHLFAAQAEVVEQLQALARFAELAQAHLRRSPLATARDFARSVAAVADQSTLAVGEPEEPDMVAPDCVQVLGLDAVGGLEVDHVFILGLGAAYRPAPETEISDGLLAEQLASRPDEDIVGQRLYTATSRATQTATLIYPESRAGRPDRPLALVEAARVEAAAEWQDRAEELFGPAETLQASYRALREELLEGTTRAAGRLAELRLDTDLDVSHAVVRYLELLKVAALMARAEGQDLGDALHDVNLRIGQAITADQREIFASSPLDDYLLAAEADEHGRAQILAARDEPSLKRFLPMRGDGVLLSAHDIDTYRSCPLKYKFARVFRIPQEPTLHQRFGIAVHQVLERFHGAAGGSDAPAVGSLAELLELLDTAWRRQGFGDSDEERQLRHKASAALVRYHEQALAAVGRPVFFERQFSFRLGRHLVRGRVDRVDRLPDGGYELIDYKTGRPKSAEALAEDVQLSLYTVAAHEAWGLEGARGAYHYLLDDAKVAIGADPERGAWIRGVANQVAEGIEAQEFEPTPSPAACGFCDYRLACPAAER